MRFLLRTFLPLSWLVPAACGFVLSSFVTFPANPATVDWTSGQVHHILPAGCHPHCGNQGDAEFIQEEYPASVENDTFGYTCVPPMGACQFIDSVVWSNDKTRHIITVTFRQRSDEVWLHLTAYH